MANGKLKWFNATKGYGFITPSDGSKDVFLHITAVEKADIQKPLKDGQNLSYDTESNNGKVSAINIKLEN